MSRAGARVCGLVVASAGIGAALGACAPAGGGPLAGPRAEADAVNVCLPAGSDRQVYFGERLTNEGDDPVEITRVTGEGDNLAAAHYFVDAEGPALDQVLGGFAWPAGADAVGHEEEVVARMTDPAGVVVEPGATVSLVFRVVPESPDEFAEVSETVVHYRSGRDEYREPILVEYGVAPGAQC